MKRLNSIIIALVFCLGGFSSCVDLNITPKNVLTAEDIFNEGGIRAYMAGVYRNLPMEDHTYNGGGGDGYFQVLPLRPIGTKTRELMSNDAGNGAGGHRTGYWSNGWRLIRQVNMLIRDLPKYPELESMSPAWIAEARFIRGFVMYQMAKRYGGLPIIEAPQDLDPDDVSTLWIARSSHEATYDFILADLEYAVQNLPDKSDAGRANKYVAAGIKSRAALTAACTAAYGSDKFQDWEVDGVLLQGIPSTKAVGYFQQAWDAAKLIIDGGAYSLADVYSDVWEKCDTNTESMWLRKYDYINSVHNFDFMFSPVRMTNGYGERYHIPLDWIELFDGLPLDSKGNFSAFDEEGNYIVYDNAGQLFYAAEPRLQYQILIPGMPHRGKTVDLRGGTFIESVDPATAKFKKFSVDDGATFSNYRTDEGKLGIPQQNLFGGDSGNNNPLILTQQNNSNNQNNPIELSNGLKIYRGGLDGPSMKWGGGAGNTWTGMIGRKYINMNMALADVQMRNCSQSWVEMRYGEILLNAAEAAIELAQRGQATYGGTDMLQAAFEYINMVRKRGGAKLLTSSSELSTGPALTTWDKPGPKGQGAWVWAPNRGLQILRVERYKELSNEAKLYWDLRRWFSLDEQFRNTNVRGLYGFMFSKGITTLTEDGVPVDGKYIWDAKQAEHYGERTTYGVNDYYESMPDLNNNPLLQKNRN